VHRRQYGCRPAGRVFRDRHDAVVRRGNEQLVRFERVTK